MKRIHQTVLAVLAIALVAGCAVRVGRAAPEARTVIALRPTGQTPAAVAPLIRSANADVVLVAAANDSAWFAELARASALQLSGPGVAGATRLGFLTRTAAVGDTTVSLRVEGGDSLVVHDALYDVPGKRYLDLLAFRIDAATPLRAAVRALLEYVATDVMPEAAVAIAVEVTEPALGDSIAAVLSPAFTDVTVGCEEEPDAAPRGIRLFYGPELRMRCERASLVAPDGVQARLVIGG